MKNSKDKFNNWLKQVDAACIKLCGMSMSDLPDAPFADWYADKVRPSSAAKRLLKLCNE